MFRYHALERRGNGRLQPAVGTRGDTRNEPVDGELTPIDVQDMDLAFHFFCVDRCGNRLLQEHLARLRGQFARIRKFTGSVPGHAEQSYREHEKIVAALRARDTAAAERGIREHLGNASVRVAAALEAVLKQTPETGGK